MNNNFSLQQLSKRGNHDPNLISRQYKLNLMAGFKRMKHKNPNMKQSEEANQLGYSSSSLQRYKNDVNMLSPYRIQPNITKKRTKKVSNSNLDINPHCEHDLKRPQLTSSDLVKPDTNTKSNKRNKNTLNGGFVH